LLALRRTLGAHWPITLLLAVVYTLASLSQVIVGHLIDKVSLKRLCMVLAQFPWLILAAMASGWWVFVALLGAMVCVFGSIPFTDAMIVRYVDDSMRLAVSFGVSSLAVWFLGPIVKASSFTSLFLLMAVISICTAAIIVLLPSDPTT
jgi:hypothetical protein